MKKAAFSLGLCLLIFIHLGVSSLCAQLQTEFGQSLLEKEPEKPETESTELILRVCTLIFPILSTITLNSD